MPPSTRTWRHKFGDAFRGLRDGVRDQSSFLIHFAVAVAVVATAGVMRVTVWEWCVLVLCITVVLAAEMFNSALESLARAITTDHDAHVGRALDTAAGAVLVAAIGAVIVGAIVFGLRIRAWW